LILCAALAAVAGQASALAAGLPGDGMAANSRACYAYAAPAAGVVTRLLVELHKEQVNPGDEPVMWARVFAGKKGQPHAGYNYDGCGAGETPGQLRCGFSCDAGTLLIEAAGAGLSVVPQGLVLRTCGSGIETIGGFQLNAQDVGGAAIMAPVESAQCRDVMAPLEKMLEDEEAVID
jgi:hypothetical protein